MWTTAQLNLANWTLRYKLWNQKVPQTIRIHNASEGHNFHWYVICFFFSVSLFAFLWAFIMCIISRNGAINFYLTWLHSYSTPECLGKCWSVFCSIRLGNLRNTNTALCVNVTGFAITILIILRPWVAILVSGDGICKEGLCLWQTQSYKRFPEV